MFEIIDHTSNVKSSFDQCQCLLYMFLLVLPSCWFPLSWEQTIWGICILSNWLLFAQTSSVNVTDTLTYMEGKKNFLYNFYAILEQGIEVSIACDLDSNVSIAHS